MLSVRLHNELFSGSEREALNASMRIICTFAKSMNKRMKTVGVIGGGSWATALVKILCNNFAQVNWFVRREDQVAHNCRNTISLFG